MEHVHLSYIYTLNIVKFHSDVSFTRGSGPKWIRITSNRGMSSSPFHVIPPMTPCRVGPWNFDQNRSELSEGDA